MDYEKKYKEALERAKQLSKELTVDDIVEQIFPELKESEDERIRTAIIYFISHTPTVPKGIIDKETMLAWLEKQGTPAQLSEEEQNRFAKGVLSSCALSFINYLDAHKYEGKMCVSNGECEDIEDAFYDAMWDKLHRYYCKYIEKQGEKKSTDNMTQQEAMDIAVAKCFNKQKAVDKVEPKFKVGNFVKDTNYHKQPIYKIVSIDKECYICESDDVTLGDKAVMHFAFDNPYLRLVEQHKFHVDDWICNSACVVHIASIKDGMYYFDECDGLDINFVDNNYHLWSIQDAKDGDILCCDSGWTCIFKSLNSDNISFSSYCFMDKTTWFCETGSEAHTLEKPFVKAYNGNIHPATNEQRDTLIKVMTDARYTFDFDKKELKKNENHAAWSEVDKDFMYDTLSNLTELKDRYGEGYGNVGKCIDWLESLSPQNRWKPSEEQVEALESATENCAYSEYQDCLRELIEQLKRL